MTHNVFLSSYNGHSIRNKQPTVDISLVQYIPRNMHTVFALLCFVVVIHWLIFPYPSGLFHWHCGNLTIAPVPAKQPWWIWINTSCEFIMNDCITTTKQSTTKPCAYFLGYTVCVLCNTSILLDCWVHGMDITAVKSPCYNTWQGPSVVKWGACRCLFKCFREVVNLRGLNWYRYT